MGGRFEYRVFDEDLSLKKEFLKKSFKTLGEKKTQEMYLVSKNIEKYNIKIRDNRLDIKKLQLLTDGFEQWEPIFKQKFPIDFKNLNSILKEEITSSDFYISEHELKDVIKSKNSINLTALSKKRLLFKKDDVLGEFAIVTVKNRIFHTVAIESDSLQSLKNITSKLKLKEYENTNYHKFLVDIISK